MRGLYSQVYFLLKDDEKNRLFFLFSGMILSGLLEVIGVASIGPFISMVSDPAIIHENSFLSHIYEYFNFRSYYEFTVISGVSVVLFIVISNVFLIYINWYIVRYTQNLQRRISFDLFSSYLAKKYSFFLLNNTSTLSKNILNEVSSAVGGLMMQALLGLTKLFIAIFLVSLLFFVNTEITLFAMFFLLFFYILLFNKLKIKLDRYGKTSVECNENMFKSISEAFDSIKTVKLMSSEHHFSKRFNASAKILANNLTKSQLINFSPKYILELIAFSLLVIAVLILLALGHHSSDVIPTISIFAIAGYKLLPAFQQIYSSIASIRYARPAFEIVYKDLSDFKVDTSSNFENKVDFEKEISLNAVNFCYPESKKKILDSFSLKIKAKETVAFIGKTGSGKTTIIDVILGLLDIDFGDLAVDGVKINSKNKKNWQSNIGYVPQYISLIDSSIEKNIAFTDVEELINPEKIRFVSSIANVDEFVDTLPKKYKTIVGDKGVRLSGGQRQRIGIARALYNDPQILVLDEATSALDDETESLIMNSIEKLHGKITIIIIAHRLSTLRKCDRIFLINGGKLEETLSFDDLVELKNLDKLKENL